MIWNPGDVHGVHNGVVIAVKRGVDGLEAVFTYPGLAFPFGTEIREIVIEMPLGEKYTVLFGPGVTPQEALRVATKFMAQTEKLVQWLFMYRRIADRAESVLKVVNAKTFQTDQAFDLVEWNGHRYCPKCLAADTLQIKVVGREQDKGLASTTSAATCSACGVEFKFYTSVSLD